MITARRAAAAALAAALFAIAPPAWAVGGKAALAPGYFSVARSYVPVTSAATGQWRLVNVEAWVKPKAPEWLRKGEAARKLLALAVVEEFGKVRAEELSDPKDGLKRAKEVVRAVVEKVVPGMPVEDVVMRTLLVF